jgi:Tol biopolymer transport system component
MSRHRMINALAVLSLAMAGGVATAAGAAPGDNTLVSITDTGIKANGWNASPSISDDGTKVAFQTKARNLDPADTDFKYDIYVKDLATGELTLVSTSDAGVKGNEDSTNPWISGNGTKVAFESNATNLDPSDPDPGLDVYVKDLTTGGITLACTSDQGVKGYGQCENASVTADGSKVAFETLSNLEPIDTNDEIDIYVKDLSTGNVSIESTSSAGTPGDSSSFRPQISADGTRVGFSSYAKNLDPRDRDNITDTYLKDIVTGHILVLPIADRGVKSNGASDYVSLSADGSKVAFVSWASNLDTHDRDTKSDIYVKDMVTGHLSLQSTSDSGLKGNDDSSAPSISADGSRVAFYTHAWNLDPLDKIFDLDVYMKNLVTGDITLASTSSSGVKGNAGSYDPAIRPDGAAVVFASGASNFDPIDLDRLADIYVKELA